MKRNLLTKITAYFILCLLVLSFSVWGIADYLGVAGSQAQWIARVNGHDITREHVIQNYRHTLQQIGLPSLDASQAQSLNIMNIIVDNLINETLVQDEAIALGLTINNTIIKEQIVRDPQFTDENTQKFNPQLFKIYLQRSGISESRFVSELSKRIRIIIMERIGQQKAPPTLSRKLYNWQFEQRKVVFIRPKLPEPNTIPTPSNATLSAYYEDNKVLFTMPSSRNFDMIHIAIHNVMQEISVDENTIASRYEDNKERFFSPAFLSAQRLSFSTEEQARKAFNRIKDNSISFQDLAKNLNLTPEIINNLIKGQSLPAINDTLFTLKKGEISKPVPLPLGFALFHITETSPERQSPLEEVRTLIDREIRQEEAFDVIYQRSIELEDTLAAQGNNISLAANNLGYSLSSFSHITRGGTNAHDGSLAHNLPPRALSLAYSLSLGEVSPLTDDGAQGYFVIRLNTENTENTRPFDTVKHLVKNAWLFSERAEKAYQNLLQNTQNLANTPVTRDTLQNLSRKINAPLTDSPLFTRNGQKVVREDQNLLPPEHLVADVFNMTQQHILIDKDNSGPLLIWLEDVHLPDNNTSQQAENEWLNTTGQITSQNLSNHLRSKASIEINTPAIQALYDIF